MNRLGLQIVAVSVVAFWTPWIALGFSLVA